MSAFLGVAVFVVEKNAVLNKWAAYDLEDDGEVPWDKNEE
jgi:hypothetical protein